MPTNDSPVTSSVAALTAPNGPFEMSTLETSWGECKVFKDTPRCVSELYLGLEEFSANIMVVYGEQRLSYQQIFDQAAALSQHLRSLNIRQGSRVAIAVGNTPAWCVSFIAVTALGATAVVMNNRGTANEIEHAVTSTQCDALIIEPRGLTRLNDELTTPWTIPAVITEITEPPTQTALTQTALLTDIINNNIDAQLPHTDCEPEAEAMILFTSGTSGKAKGAILSHRGVLTSLMTNRYSAALVATQMAERYGIDLETLYAHRPAPATLLIFPLFHVSGCHSVFLTNLVQGGKMVLMPKWIPEEALRLIEQEKVSTLPGVPTMFWDLLQVENFGDFQLDSLSSLSIGGQATPPAVIDAVLEAFPNVVLGTGYGMTETNGAITLTVGDDFTGNPSSTGKAVATTEICILDDNHQPLPAGDRGEICVRGATLMEGYANAKNDELLADGWLPTGDIGMLDDQDRLYILDRRTDMVISGGENIYCAEVENALILHPDVNEAAAFGQPDERLGEKLIVVVSCPENATIDAEDIRKSVGKHIAAYKVPHELRATREPLPRNASGKLIKADIKKLYAQLK